MLADLIALTYATEGWMRRMMHLDTDGPCGLSFAQLALALEASHYHWPA